MTSKDWARDIWVLCLVEAVAIVNLLVFGMVHWTSWKDAAAYSSYAKNLLLGNGYSLDGIHFDIYREPGTSFFLVPFYKFFGIESELSIFAVMFTQTILLGLVGFIFFKIIQKHDNTWAAICAGVCISLWPILGDYTTQIGAEIIFTFGVALTFYLCVYLVQSKLKAAWYWYAIFGLICGITTLIRTQFILFLPFLIGCLAIYLLYRRMWPENTIRNIIITLAFFAVLPASFATYVHANTGMFAITAGRQEEMLYFRARRAELSYTDISRYMRDWLWRSVSGGYNTQLLIDNEFHKLGYEYGLLATTSEAVAHIRAENIATIISRPGHFLYGNLVEMVKLAYLEHDYSNTWNRYFWPSLYALLYSFFLFGIYQLVRSKNNWDVKILALLVLIFLTYNFLSLSFVSVVPRFNTPYIPFYILIGTLGVILYRRKREPAKNLKLFE